MLGEILMFKVNPLNGSMRRRTKHETESNRNLAIESSASIIVSDSIMASGRKVYDHWSFLENNPYARLVELTCYGYNYITAIETKFQIPGEEELVTFLHQGVMHDHSKKNEMHEKKIVLEPTEQIETIN